jgi:hypothetical protein
MGYWKSTMERFKIQDYSEHPWAELLKQALAAVEPLTASNCFKLAHGRQPTLQTLMFVG